MRLLPKHVHKPADVAFYNRKWQIQREEEQKKYDHV
jgi:hypothetical protein